ncbi:MAG: inward rectifier potassium channel [Polyangiales bacterium]
MTKLKPERRDPKNLVAPRRLSTVLSRDFFFYFVDGSWRRIVGFFCFSFILINTVFAALFLLDSESIVGGTGSFIDAFSFSVQTMSGIGYGALSPGNTYANVLVAIEAVISLLGIAVATGFVVAKATRARARVQFSNVFVIEAMNGMPVLSFRAGNARANEVVHARIKVTALLDETTDEGHTFRRLRDLKLQRDESPVFSLTWTVMHTLDEASPLFEYDWNDKDGPLRRLIVTLHAHDGTYGQSIHARHDFRAEDARVGERFVDVLKENDKGQLWVDYDRLDETESV